MSTDRSEFSADAATQVDPGYLEATPGPRVQSPRPDSNSLRRWVFPAFALLIMAVSIQTNGWWEGYAVRLARQYLSPRGNMGQGFYPNEDFGVDGMILFHKHDLNGDGLLSQEEFKPLAHRLLTFNDTIKYDRNISAEEEIVTLDVKFQPLQWDTMTKDFSIKSDLDSFRGLKQWKSPVKPWQNFGVRDFRSFMPRNIRLPEALGQVYWIVEGSKERGPSLPSNRYIPPPLESEMEIMVHRLLSLFHPLPFVHMRFSPKGSTAIIRAYNDEFVEIVFRIHAEFQLNVPPYYPFWYTPAQFTGHLIISRDARHVVDFHLYVPTDKSLNVDMEWITGAGDSPNVEWKNDKAAPENIENMENMEMARSIRDSSNMEVDIGYMPQMELSSTGESRPAIVNGEDRRETYFRPDSSVSKENLVWTEEISAAEAHRRLEVEMYPFKQVMYYNFTEGLKEATRLNVPLHSVLLWGCLDDQSC